MPQESPRHCEVHSCVLIDGDGPCAEGRAECTAPRGHLQKIGNQVDSLEPVAEYDMSSRPLNASSFWADALSKSRPLLLRGGAASATELSRWTDEALLEVCKHESGAPLRVIVEKQNRVTQNDRYPMISDWDFCKFLDEYRKPEYDNMLYLLLSLAKRGLRLSSRLGLPSVLACDDLYHSLYDANLWMSRGNTSSSVHFDANENLLMQIDGEKEVLMWHPNASGHLYMDHHNKRAISPVNVDRVDLQRFPEVRTRTHIHMHVDRIDLHRFPELRTRTYTHALACMGPKWE